MLVKVQPGFLLSESWIMYNVHVHPESLRSFLTFPCVFSSSAFYSLYRSSQLRRAAMFITNMLWKYFFHIVKIFLLCCLSTYFGGCIYPATWGPLVTTSPLCLQPVTGRRTRWKESSREMQNTFCEMQKYFLRNEKYFLRDVKILSKKCKNSFWEMQKYFLRNARILSEKWKILLRNAKTLSEKCKNTFWEMQRYFLRNVKILS